MAKRNQATMVSVNAPIQAGPYLVAVSINPGPREAGWIWINNKHATDGLQLLPEYTIAGIVHQELSTNVPAMTRAKLPAYPADKLDIKVRSQTANVVPCDAGYSNPVVE